MSVDEKASFDSQTYTRAERDELYRALGIHSAHLENPSKHLVQLMQLDLFDVLQQKNINSSALTRLVVKNFNYYGRSFWERHGGKLVAGAIGVILIGGSIALVVMSCGILTPVAIGAISGAATFAGMGLITEAFDQHDHDTEKARMATIFITHLVAGGLAGAAGPLCSFLPLGFQVFMEIGINTFAKLSADTIVHHLHGGRHCDDVSKFVTFLIFAVSAVVTHGVLSVHSISSFLHTVLKKTVRDATEETIEILAAMVIKPLAEMIAESNVEWTRDLGQSVSNLITQSNESSRMIKITSNGASWYWSQMIVTLIPKTLSSITDDKNKLRPSLMQCHIAGTGQPVLVDLKGYDMVSFRAHRGPMGWGNVWRYRKGGWSKMKAFFTEEVREQIDPADIKVDENDYAIESFLISINPTIAKANRVFELKFNLAGTSSFAYLESIEWNEYNLQLAKCSTDKFEYHCNGLILDDKWPWQTAQRVMRTPSNQFDNA